jgi:prevent-host-death family protein
MKTVNIHEARTHLSRLVDEALRGQPFVIAKSGKPLVKVMPLGAPDPSGARSGWAAAARAVAEFGADQPAES